MPRRLPRRAFLPLAALWAGVAMPALVFSQQAGQGVGQATGQQNGQGTAIQGPTRVVVTQDGTQRILFSFSAPRLPRLLSEMVMPVPPDNPMSEEKVVLGRRLFFDTNLSLDHSISCG